jgi:hypothetical protein
MERATQQRVHFGDIFPSPEFHAEEAAAADDRNEPNVVVKLDRRIKTALDESPPEARVIIPGCQALLGFQLVAMLTQAFDELPNDAKK